MTLETWIDFAIHHDDDTQDSKFRLRMQGNWPEFQVWRWRSQKWESIEREKRPTEYGRLLIAATNAGLIRHRGYDLMQEIKMNQNLLKSKIRALRLDLEHLDAMIDQLDPQQVTEAMAAIDWMHQKLLRFGQIENQHVKEKE